MLTKLIAESSKHISTFVQCVMFQLILGATMMTAITVSFPVVSAQPRQSGVLLASDFPGQDLGAKINAADKALGAKSGEIVIKGGGIISTQAIISSDHI